MFPLVLSMINFDQRNQNKQMSVFSFLYLLHFLYKNTKYAGALVNPLFIYFSLKVMIDNGLAARYLKTSCCLRLYFAPR